MKLFSRTESKLDFTVIPRDQHNVSRKLISPNALKVLYRLKNAGHEAYLVGGCVRDLMLGLQPKDFDVATAATPEQLKQLFRNSRIIGRRFRIVHVTFGREIIEVTTFRAAHESSDADNTQPPGKQLSATSEHGMLVRDNVYGSMEDDALRRDFTVNAFYYNIDDFSIKLFSQGLKDFQAKTLRIIGDPQTRYREDPVRMLRAARFAAKLQFSIADETRTPITELSHLLQNVSSARLFDETLKLFLSGQAVRTFEQLEELNIMSTLFPDTVRALQEDSSGFYRRLIVQALRNTDTRVNQGKPVTPAFLYAALLWPAVQANQQVQPDAMPPLQKLQKSANIVLSEQVRITAIPKRFSIPMKEIWELQQRLEKRQKAKAMLVLEHPRFRAAYDFLMLREEAGENTQGRGSWWTDFQHSDPDAKKVMLANASQQASRPKRRRRPPRPRRPASPS